VIWSAAIGSALAVASGCATVRTTIPPSEYKNLRWPTTYTIISRDGEIREASDILKQDSSLVVVRPRYPLNDRRKYPVTIAYDDIESIETVQHRNILHVEAGAEGGPNLGDDSDEYSSWIGVIELGYVAGELTRPVPRGWGYGGTMFVALGESAARVGLKARARYRFNPDLSLDFGAGPMLDTPDDGFLAGFVGGVGLRAWSSLSVRSEIVTYHVKPWSERETHVNHPGGTEVVWYNGAAVLGTPAWITMGVAFVAIIVYAGAMASSMSSLD
jgi:hypothetical protein